MFETVVTVVGRVAGELTRRRTGDDVQVVSFRMPAQERRYDRDTDEWSDGERMFLPSTAGARSATTSPRR